MLLLLFAGAGSQAPVVDGVRAYGNTTYRATVGGADNQSVIVASSVSLAALTGASGNTVASDGDSSAGAVTSADTTEE
jgi:hypothetical protein